MPVGRALIILREGAGSQWDAAVVAALLAHLDAAAVTDSAPVAPVAVEPGLAPVGFVPVAASGFGFGIGALLAGLVAVAGLAAVLLTSNDEGRLPLSPD